MSVFQICYTSETLKWKTFIALVRLSKKQFIALVHLRTGSWFFYVIWIPSWAELGLPVQENPIRCDFRAKTLSWQSRESRQGSFGNGIPGIPPSPCSTSTQKSTLDYKLSWFWWEKKEILLALLLNTVPENHKCLPICFKSPRSLLADPGILYIPLTLDFKRGSRSSTEILFLNTEKCSSGWYRWVKRKM